MPVHEEITARTALRMTEDEFVAWADDDTRAEYVDGEVIVLSPESRVDEDIRWLIGGALRAFVERHKVGRVYGPNMLVRLRTGVRRTPDLLFVSAAHLDRIREAHVEGAPDLIMEIVSRDSAARDWHDKFAEYEAAAVREYWIVDPAARRVDVYALDSAGRYSAQPQTEGAWRSTAVPGFFIRPEWLWQEPLPETIELLRALGVIN
ncbi:MAG: Uma2 family endonuclease [Acidobacteriota bacterium]